MTAYDKGYRDGLAAFAHWKDGVQYVGTCGTTLHDALLAAVNHESYRPPKGDLLASCKWLIQFAERFAKDHNDGPTMAAMIGQARHAIAEAEAM